MVKLAIIVEGSICMYEHMHDMFTLAECDVVGHFNAAFAE
jgi:hypothetical protein